MTTWTGYNWLSDRPASATWGLAVQMSEREHEWVIRADLPEVERSKINLFVSNQELTITAPSKSSTPASDAGYYRAERRLPEGVFPEEVRANFREGVLEITLPKSERPVRRVPIESGYPQ